MKNRVRHFLFVTAAAVLAVGLLSCVPEGVSMMADAMAGSDAGMDSGSPMRDAMVGVLDAMADAMQPDAAAQGPDVYMGTCDQVDAAGLKWAEISIAGLDPHDVVEASYTLCDCTGPGCPNEPSATGIEAGATCLANGGSMFPGASDPPRMGPGFVRVYCGTSSYEWTYVQVALRVM